MTGTQLVADPKHWIVLPRVAYARNSWLRGGKGPGARWLVGTQGFCIRGGEVDRRNAASSPARASMAESTQPDAP